MNPVLKGEKTVQECFDFLGKFKYHDFELFSEVGSGNLLLSREGIFVIIKPDGTWTLETAGGDEYNIPEMFKKEQSV